MKNIYLLMIILAFAAVGCAQDTDHNSAGHTEHHDKSTTDKAENGMGFSQSATTHHFLIREGGGVIQVEVNDPKDTVNRDKVRGHLAEIAKQFKEGVFTTPFAVHGEMPPGVPEMDKLKDEITYSYEQTDDGGRVNIHTENADALAAIHAFLRFQIEEHKTGDPTEVVK